MYRILNMFYLLLNIFILEDHNLSKLLSIKHNHQIHPNHLIFIMKILFLQ